MPYIAPVVGYVDGKGYVRCPSCHEGASEDAKRTAVPTHADNSANEGEDCDTCHSPIEFSRRKVQVPW